MRARDIMDTRFHTLRPTNSISDAINVFHTATIEQQKRIFGIMVTDENDRLVGILSMYDILTFIQPKHVHIWGEMDDLEPEKVFASLLNRVKWIRVGDIMTTEVIAVSPDTHVMLLADLMIKRHFRLLPVVHEENVVGVVYISDLLYHLIKKFL